MANERMKDAQRTARPVEVERESQQATALHQEIETRLQAKERELTTAQSDAQVLKRNAVNKTRERRGEYVLDHKLGTAAVCDRDVRDLLDLGRLQVLLELRGSALPDVGTDDRLRLSLRLREGKHQKGDQESEHGRVQ